MAIFENSRLTKRAIDALEPRAKPFIAFDLEVVGFGVRVMPSGLKSFILEYRPGAGGRNVNKRRMTLGRYGAMTPDQAGKAALTALAHVRLGSDPQAEKSRQRTALTVSGLIDAYLDDHGGKLKPRTRMVTRRCSAKYERRTATSRPKRCPVPKLQSCIDRCQPRHMPRTECSPRYRAFTAGLWIMNFCPKAMATRRRASRASRNEAANAS